MLAFSVPSKWSAHNRPHLSTLLPNVLCSFRWGVNSVQLHCIMSVVFNELSIVTSEAQEASDVLTALSPRPIRHHTNLMLLGIDSVLLNIKAAKIAFLTSPGTFCLFGLQTMFCQ
jgi:hypothetical protein